MYVNTVKYKFLFIYQIIQKYNFHIFKTNYYLHIWYGTRPKYIKYIIINNIYRFNCVQIYKPET